MQLVGSLIAMIAFKTFFAVIIDWLFANVVFFCFCREICAGDHKPGLQLLHNVSFPWWHESSRAHYTLQNETTLMVLLRVKPKVFNALKCKVQGNLRIKFNSEILNKVL